MTNDEIKPGSRVLIPAILLGVPFKDVAHIRVLPGVEPVIPLESVLINHPAFKYIQDERQRQNKKWGVQRHSWAEWSAILGEEYGEVCEAVVDVRWNGMPLDNLRNELVQLAAVSVQIIEHIDESWRGECHDE